MYTPKNTPNGKMQKLDKSGKWKDVTLREFLEDLRQNSFRPVEQYDAIISAGVRGAPAGTEARVGAFIYRFEPFSA
jgi:hypothetical protein